MAYKPDYSEVSLWYEQENISEDPRNMAKSMIIATLMDGNDTEIKNMYKEAEKLIKELSNQLNVIVLACNLLTNEYNTLIEELFESKLIKWKKV